MVHEHSRRESLVFQGLGESARETSDSIVGGAYQHVVCDGFWLVHATKVLHDDDDDFVGHCKYSGCGRILDTKIDVGIRLRLLQVNFQLNHNLSLVVVTYYNTVLLFRSIFSIIKIELIINFVTVDKLISH